MPTRREYLSEKRSNFINWLSTLLSPDLLSELKKVSEMDFCLYITRYVIPHKEDLEPFMEDMATNLEINIQEFSSQDRDKFKRYLLLFCDILT